MVFWKLFNRLAIVTLLYIMSVGTAHAQINTERMINVGRSALSMDDYALSIQYFSLAINSKPYLYEPYYYRGLAKFFLEDYIGAENDLTKAIDLNPYYPDSYQIRGLSRINQKKFDSAAMDYEKATKMDPDNKSVWHNLIICDIQLDSLEKADRVADSLLRKWPKYCDAYNMKAEICLKKNDEEGAEHNIDRTLTIDRYNVPALSLKADMQIKRMEYTEAENTLTESIRLQPKNVRNIINRALCRYNLDNYLGTMKDYDMAIGLDSTNFIAHYNRGLLLAFVGDDNKAIEDFNYILSVDPEDIMTVYNRATLLDRTGDYRGAIRDYTHIIKEYPKFIQGYRLRAAARRKIGDLNGALRDEEHIIRENAAQQYGYSTPTSQLHNKKMRRRKDIDLNDYQQLVIEDDKDAEPEYSSELRGKIQNRHSDVRFLGIYALADFEIEMLGATSQAFNHFTRGVEYLIAKDYNTAILAFTESIRHQANLAGAYYNRAYAYAMLEKYDQAIADLGHAIEIRPTFAEAYFNRGIAHIFKANATEQAVSDLSKAGELGIYSAYNIIKQQQKK